MGDTTMRFFRRKARTCNGNSMGGATCGRALAPAAPAWDATDPAGAGSAVAIQASKPFSHAGSRRRRFSWLMRCERVNRE